MKDARKELCVRVTIVRVMHHQARIQVSRGGFASLTDDGRTLLEDLYSDPTIIGVLTRHGVVVPEEWVPTVRVGSPGRRFRPAS